MSRRETATHGDLCRRLTDDALAAMIRDLGRAVPTMQSQLAAARRERARRKRQDARETASR